MLVFAPGYVMSIISQPVLIVLTSDKKYTIGVPFKILPKQVGLYTYVRM